MNFVMAPTSFMALEVVTLASWAVLAWIGLRSETVPTWALYGTGAATIGITLGCLVVGVFSFLRSLFC